MHFALRTTRIRPSETTLTTGAYVAKHLGVGDGRILFNLLGSFYEVLSSFPSQGDRLRAISNHSTPVSTFLWIPKNATCAGTHWLFKKVLLGSACRTAWIAACGTAWTVLTGPGQIHRLDSQEQGMPPSKNHLVPLTWSCTTQWRTTQVLRLGRTDYALSSLTHLCFAVALLYSTQKTTAPLLSASLEAALNNGRSYHRLFTWVAFWAKLPGQHQSCSAIPHQLRCIVEKTRDYVRDYGTTMTLLSHQVCFMVSLSSVYNVSWLSGWAAFCARRLSGQHDSFPAGTLLANQFRRRMVIARTLLVAPGLTTRSKKLLVTKGIATNRARTLLLVNLQCCVQWWTSRSRLP